jgi:hypothetical protein
VPARQGQRGSSSRRSFSHGKTRFPRGRPERRRHRRARDRNGLGRGVASPAGVHTGGKRLYPNAKFLTFDSISAQFNAVKVGRAAAAQLDVPVARYYAL